MASVTPRKNKDGTTTWRVLFRINGKPVGDSFGDPGLSVSDNEKAAREYAALVKRVGGQEARKILYSRRRNKSTPTLASYTRDYLDPASGHLTGIQPGTRAGYQRIAKHSFLQILGEYPIDAIGKTDVGRWVQWQEKQPASRFVNEDGTMKDGWQPLAAKTVRNYHALLSNVFKAAVEEGYRTDNPAFRTRLSAGRPREAVFLSVTEFYDLLECFPASYRPFVEFLAHSQMRWSEATALTWGDVSMDTIPPTVRINKAWKKNPDGSPVIGVPKSKAGVRTVAMDPDIIALLGKPERPGELVFKGHGAGNRVWYSAFQKVWNKAVIAADLGKRPNIHDLRHSGVSWLIADGIPLLMLQRRLGHEDVKTTSSIYGHLFPDAHIRMVSSLATARAAQLEARQQRQLEA